MGEYLESVPKPLIEAVVRGRVIPIVGAGFSKNAIIPDGLSMADWNELGEHVAAQIPDYEYGNTPVDALSYFEHEFGRANLIELLKDILHVDVVRPGKVHTLLCSLFPGTICTTNYDFLLEDSAKLLLRPVSVIVTEGALTVSGRSEGRLIKLHGDFGHPERMVITEHDYDVYLDQNPLFATYLANLFITNTMLLIGYSLDDSDFRSVWQVVNSRFGRMARQAYAIEVGASAAKVARFARRNIRVINLPMHPQGYRESLRCFMCELKEYVDSERDREARSTDDAVNAQMVIPAEHNSLCFVSCAMARIARLSALLYPALYEVGVTPVGIDGMLVPGAIWTDVAETALRKSRFVIVDVSDSSESVAYEAGLAAAMGVKDVLFVCEQEAMTSLSFTAFASRRVLTYSFDSPEQNQQFVRLVREWIRDAVRERDGGADLGARSSLQPQFKNAHLLYEEGEYSACIVSACSEFEYYVRGLYPGRVEGYYGLGGLREFLSGRLRVPLADSRDYGQLMSLRNRIVHDEYQATRKDAKEALLYLRMLGSLLVESS